MKKVTQLSMVILAGVLLAGCGTKEPEKIEASNPACGKLSRTTDPDEIAALLKECPKGLPEGFKASEKKSW
jgi:entry exclusion lipoprotein TrbK